MIQNNYDKNPHKITNVPLAKAIGVKNVNFPQKDVVFLGENSDNKNNEEYLKNIQIQQAKTSACGWSVIPIVGLFFALSYLLKKPENMVDPNAQNQEKELEKQQELHRAEAKGALIGALGTHTFGLGGIAVYFYFKEIEDPQKPVI